MYLSYAIITIETESLERVFFNRVQILFAVLIWERLCYVIPRPNDKECVPTVGHNPVKKYS